MVQDGPPPTPPPPPTKPSPPQPAPTSVARLKEPRAVAIGRAAARLRFAGIVAAVLAVLTPPLAVVAFRQGWMSFAMADGFLMRGTVPVLALVAIVLGVVALTLGVFGRPRRGAGVALATVAVGALVYAGLVQAHAREDATPPIHDVSTDWRDPPMPTARLADLRGPRANPVELAPSVPEGPGRAASAGFLGRQVAEVNARTCPAATPVTLTLPPPEAYLRAKAALKAQKLALITDDPAAGRLEAVARRGAWAVADDVMLRVRPDGAGARVDLRSVSRSGLGDGGANCARVTKLRAALGS